MTKKEARQHKAEWQEALREGRVVRYLSFFEGGLAFRSFLTPESAQEFVRLNGAVNAEIIQETP